MKDVIRFTLNGKSVTLSADSDRSLLWVLRTDYGLTGAKYGCGEGRCGSYKRNRASNSIGCERFAGGPLI